MIRYWFFALFVLVARPGAEGRHPAASPRPRGSGCRSSAACSSPSRSASPSSPSCSSASSAPTRSSRSIRCSSRRSPARSSASTWAGGAASPSPSGSLGMLVILRPGFQVMSPVALVPFAGALLFAVYALLTRLVASTDSAETSLFYTGIAGAVAITLVGPFFWTPDPRRLRLVLDADPLRLRRPRPLPDDQGLRGGRGRHHPALRLLPARLRQHHGLRPLRRAPRRLDHRRRRADPRRRASTPWCARRAWPGGSRAQGPASTRATGPSESSRHHLGSNTLAEDTCAQRRFAPGHIGPCRVVQRAQADPSESELSRSRR